MPHRLILLLFFLLLGGHISMQGRPSLANPKDFKSCETCHGSLSEALPENHEALVEEEIKDCLICHVGGDQATAFDYLMHIRHYSTPGFGGDCLSCHAVDQSGKVEFTVSKDHKQTKIAPDSLGEISVYFQSWATPNYLDHQHARNLVTCDGCHGTFFPEVGVSTEECLGCHGTYEHVATLTQDADPNPHHSHYPELRCTLCHKAHQESVLYCSQCHIFDLEIP